MDMSNFGIGLLQNGDVFIGRIKEGKWHGAKHVVTNEFITLMLMKFTPNQEFNLMINGRNEFSVEIKKLTYEEHPAQIKMFDKENTIMEDPLLPNSIKEMENSDTIGERKD